MKEKLQRFGGAMMQPTLLFPFYGVILGLVAIITNQTIWHWSQGILDGNVFKFLHIIENGGWTIFNVLPPLFAIGLAAGLVEQEKFKAAIAAFILYVTFLVLLNAYMSTFNIGVGPHSRLYPHGVLLGDKFYGQIMDHGPFKNKLLSTLCAGDLNQTFKINAKDCYNLLPSLSNYSWSVEHGIKSMLGVPTPDMNILGGLFVGAITTIIHNKFYSQQLPKVLGVFQGLAYVVTIGFFAMLVLAIVMAYLWPFVQNGLNSFTGILKKIGALGVWVYVFLERALLPAGFHHFIYGPFIFGPAVTPEGITPWWLAKGVKITSQAEWKHAYDLIGGFSLHGNSKIFGLPAAALAMISVAKTNQKQIVKGMLVSAAAVAAVTGITEPLEFTFLFLAPQLFFVHAALGATLSTILYLTGLTGNFGAGLIDAFVQNWIPLWHVAGNHFIIQIVVGLIFSIIYFYTFKILILKFNLPTPGRGEEVKLYSKQDYKNKTENKSPYFQRANDFLSLLGGRNNIESVTNCATRLRVKVKDSSLVSTNVNDYIAANASGFVKTDETSFQIIVGLDVANVRSEFENIMMKG